MLGFRIDNFAYITDANLIPEMEFGKIKRFTSICCKCLT